MAMVIRQVEASVVKVETSRGGRGSGVIVDVDQAGNATIVTNHHVIAGHSSVTVRVNDAFGYSATVVGYDAAKDLAVSGCVVTVAVELPDDAVFAIALGWDAIATRVVATVWNRGRWAETDAAINPGNWRAAVQPASVGMPIRETPSGRPVEGFGFAVAEDGAVAVPARRRKDA